MKKLFVVLLLLSTSATTFSQVKIDSGLYIKAKRHV